MFYTLVRTKYKQFVQNRPQRWSFHFRPHLQAN
jgi:hypothetical protein